MNGRTRTWTIAIALLSVLVALQACNHGGSRATPLGSPERVTIEQVEAWMAEGRELVLIDSRSDVAWERGATKARGAIRVPPNDVDSVLEQIPRDGALIVYCT